MSVSNKIDVDMIETKVIIINSKLGLNHLNSTTTEPIKNITINIDTITNVLALKHSNTIAVLINPSSSSSSLNVNSINKIYIKINDYELKTLYLKSNENNNHTNQSVGIFDSLTFKKQDSSSLCYNESCKSGINANFRLDTKNYVFNPILNKLMKLTISFWVDTTNFISDEEIDFSMELCIYSNRAKLTMV